MYDDLAAHYELLEQKRHLIAKATALNAQCRALVEESQALLARAKATERRNADLLKRMGQRPDGKG
jgi:hypothetical protein